MTAGIALVLGLLLALKHFVIDGPLQTAYMYLNKGKLNHPGGYVHAGLHGLFTGFIMSAVGLWWLGIVDAVIHFFVDWAKVNLTQKYKWSGMFRPAACQDDQTPHLAIYSDFYFYALIADQCLHFATYVGLIYLAST